MIRFTVVTIDSLDDYDEKLRKAIPEELVDDHVITCLRDYIGTKCKTIKVEYPYHDRDYTSTYYEYYAQKFKKYSKECCRLHLESDSDYLGYISLRPTIPGTKLGKTYIKPQMLLDKEAYLMQCTFSSVVYGQDVQIDCFPWKKQQTDISCCAHTALWTVLRYYGNKYPNYADTTIGNIVQKVKNDWGRKTPSQGLTPVQISDLLKEYGFSPLIIGRDNQDYHEFVAEILAYIESGLPMIGFLSPQEHAISIIGHGKVNYDILKNKENLNRFIDKKAGVISHSRLISSIYVMDDRYFPYREVPIALPNKNSDVNYGVDELCYAAVPLYNRMQLTYRDVYNRMIAWLKLKEMKWEALNVCRIYITSSNSLKRRAMESKTMPELLKDIIISLSLPRFVWCIDLAGVDNYYAHKTSGRIIVDTTSATGESDPWILRHDMERIEYKDYDTTPIVTYSINAQIEPYDFYENNLKKLEE